MRLRKVLGTTVLCIAVVIGANVSARIVRAQDASASQTNVKDDETNLDTQLYLVVGTNQDVADPRLPPALDGVIKQLRASLPFKNYRLAATLLNRVKNEGRLNLRWLGGPFAAAASSAVTPSFSDFSVRQVRLVKNADGQPIVQMVNFAFGARIPIQAGTSIASNSSAAPVIAYENTGLNTDISMREGEPVIVGTLNIGPSGDAIILVVSAKRTMK